MLVPVLSVPFNCSQMFITNTAPEMKVLYFDKLSRDVARGVVWGFKPPPRNFFEAASKRGLVFLPAKLLPSDNP